MSALAGTAVGPSARRPQLEGDEKLSGSAQYIADLYRPGMLHGAILQSPHAHARIRGYDLSRGAGAARRARHRHRRRSRRSHRMGAFIKDEPAFAKGKVRYVGEIVAAVAADTEAIARAAARLVRVDYEELPAGRSIPQRRSRRARRWCTRTSARYVKVFDAGTDGNLCSRTDFRERRRRRGVGANATSSSRRRYTTQAQAHLSLEPCGALAEIDAGGPRSRCGRRTSRCSASRPTCANRSACR